MKYLVLFLAGFSLWAPSALAQFRTLINLSGRVLDAENNAPLANVNVFLSQTLLGCATNTNGEFVLNGVPLGTHDLIVSCIGYETQRSQARFVVANNRVFEFRLKPRVLQAPAVEVVASRPVEWQKRLKEFETFFLGTSPNAGKTKISNPEVLDFKPGQSQNEFIAAAADFLKIENRALGYRIYYLLEAFGLNDEVLKYTGNTRFEELTPKSDKERRGWETNRRNTYLGSLRHFLAALTAQTVDKEGFLVYRMQEMEENIYAADRETVNSASLFSPGELPFERNLHFLDVLQVVYAKEMEEQEYILWRLNYDKSALNMTSQKRHESTRPQAQTSWMTMNKTSVIIDTSGYIYDPLAVTVFGYWAWLGVADMLPYEYSPSN
ncbi:MAG TPA: carboxypeptidase-like regulatory domain-containing protein [bacterium]